MKKIAIINQKGGTGKTTSTVGIAGCLEQFHKKKVLVFDCDESMNSTSYLTTFDQDGFEPGEQKGIVEVVHGECKLSEIIRRVKLDYKKNIIDTNMYVVPAYMKMEEECVFETPFVLRNLLKEVEDDYDFCLFDCPPHLTSFAYEALACTDYVIVPAMADTDSLGGLNLLTDQINELRNSGTNTNIYMLGIFFNNVNPQYALNKYISESTFEKLGDLVFDQKIRSASAISQARFFGQPITYYKTSAGVSQDYANLTNEILAKIRKRERK